MSDDRADETKSGWSEELDAMDDTDATDTQDTTGPFDVDRIRESWDAASLRLPDPLQRRWHAYHSSLESDMAMAGIERPYGKDRYYKPLVVALGLRELDAMDTTDVVDALDELERKGHLED